MKKISFFIFSLCLLLLPLFAAPAFAIQMQPIGAIENQSADTAAIPLSPEEMEPVILEAAGMGIPVEEIPHQKTGERIAEYLRAHGVTESHIILMIATLPIVELRGAIPVGHLRIPDDNPDTKHDAEDWKRAGRIFGWAVLGNMLPVPFILLLLGPCSRLCMRIPIGKKFFEWLFARTRRKTADIEKYETLGLTVFVAIPLPATGAWTGAMAGWLLGMSFWHSFFSILLGVCIAGVIMTILSLLGWYGVAIAGIVLALFFGGIFFKMLFKDKKEHTA